MEITDRRRANRLFPCGFPENFEIYSQEAIAADPELRSLENELKVARKNISLSKFLWFPKFEIGYIREMEPTDKYNGISFGISIPLFENRKQNKTGKSFKRIYSNANRKHPPAKSFYFATTL